MSNKWKITIGVAAACAILLCVGLPAAGYVLFKDDISDHISERRETEWQISLVDDDGDDVPDRGVIEESHLGANRLWRSGPGHAGDFGHARGPFGFFRGLMRLAFIVALVVLGVMCLRRRRESESQSQASIE